MKTTSIKIALIASLLTWPVFAEAPETAPLSERLAETLMHRIWLEDDGTPAGIPRAWSYEQGVQLKAVERIRSQLKTHPRTKEGGFWHKKIYPWQMWLDGLYMGQPFYAEYSLVWNEDNWNDIADQFSWMEQHARDPETGLLRHGWDESKHQRWADRETSASPHAWGRAMGWYAMALVDVLDYFPKDHPRRAGLVAILNREAESIARYQDKDGLWWDILDLAGKDKNYHESSCAAMFAYALAKGVRQGNLPPQYLDTARRGWAGIQKEFIRELPDGSLDWEGTVSVSGLGGNPYRDGSFEYYTSEKVRTNDAKGLGPAVMAAIEMESLACGPQPSDKIGKIVVSSNGRLLQYEDGRPFFWLGDTAWNLFQRLDRNETERYLENRRIKGFNVVQAVAFHGSGERNAYGSEALFERDAARPNITPGNDFSIPGEYDYWDHIDWVVDLAAQKGIYIGMLPVWGSSVKTKTLNAENAEIYAGWLAARYKNKPNLFWILGGDIRGDIGTDIWNALGQKLKREDPNHLITFHPFGRTQSSAWFHNEPWLDFNMFQSGHRRYDQDDTPGAKGEENWRYVNEDYAREPPKPTLDGEPSYENIPQGLHDPRQPYWTDKECRRYAYWSVFAGSAGHTYGNNAVMQMHKPGSGPGAFGVRNYWYEAIDEPGAGQMQYLKRLMLSRPYFERIPDQGLIAGENGTRDTYIVATQGSSYIFAYAYTGRPFEIQMGIISGQQVQAWWYDPRNGSARHIGTFPNQGVHAFTPPGSPAPGNDWVLVLDDAANKFVAPGVRRQ